LTARYASIFDDADLEPLRNRAQDALVRDTVLEEPDDLCVGHGIVGRHDRLPTSKISQNQWWLRASGTHLRADRLQQSPVSADAACVSFSLYYRTAPARSFRPHGLIGMRRRAAPQIPTFPTISTGLMICSAYARSSTLSSAGPLSRRRMRGAAMQLHLAFPERARVSKETFWQSYASRSWSAATAGTTAISH